MIKEELQRKKVTISDFKAHCTEYIRELENTDEIIEITRHGKVVAIAKKPENSDSGTPETITNLMGSLRGTATFGDDYDPHEPAFDPDDWEMNKS